MCCGSQELQRLDYAKQVTSCKLTRVTVAVQKGVDYEPLRQALLEGDFLKADDIHRKKLIEVAGEDAVERGWVYFTEVCCAAMPLRPSSALETPGTVLVSCGGLACLSCHAQLK